MLGLRTAIYPTPDLARGKAFYEAVLGRQPHFDEPYYVGFSVGGFELGLIPDAIPGSTGTRVYWGVADIDAEWERLLGLGAVVHEPIQDVGAGIRLGAVLDPFGNVLGIIVNPGFQIVAAG